MSFVATIVIHEAVTKLDALQMIATVSGALIQESGSAHPFIVLASGSRVDIDVPKFGEAPPMAVDVSSDVSADLARRDAIAVQILLQETARWTVLQDW